MARKPKSLDVFHKYVGDTLQVVKGESAQACVLILSATLEQALMTLLGSFLMECTTADEMFKPNGELESFFKCTRMAYCLGFIPDAVRKNLETIGKIRNRFAHETIMIDFSDKEVSDHCKTLTLPKQSFLTSTVTEHEFENDLRVRFTEVWGRLVLYLLFVASRNGAPRTPDEEGSAGYRPILSATTSA